MCRPTLESAPGDRAALATATLLAALPDVPQCFGCNMDGAKSLGLRKDVRRLPR